jgi:hypothetical protein
VLLHIQDTQTYFTPIAAGLLQALKQALEGADFREFADRVSVVLPLVDWLMSDASAAVWCAVSFDVCCRHIHTLCAIGVVKQRHAMHYGCKQMCCVLQKVFKTTLTPNTLTAAAAAVVQMLSVMKPKEYPKVP